MFDEAARRRNFQFLMALWCAFLGGAISLACYLFLLNTPQIDQRFAAMPLPSRDILQLLIILPAVPGGAILGGWVGWRIAPWLVTRQYRYWILAVLPSISIAAVVAADSTAPAQHAMPQNAMVAPQAIGVSLFTLGIPFLLRRRGGI